MYEQHLLEDLLHLSELSKRPVREVALVFEHTKSISGTLIIITAPNYNPVESSDSGRLPAYTCNGECPRCLFTKKMREKRKAKRDRERAAAGPRYRPAGEEEPEEEDDFDPFEPMYMGRCY
jgi:hypothetical protein